MATSEYSTSALARDAVSQLTSIVDGLRVNDLASYINPALRKDFITDEGYIKGALDNATNAAYSVQRASARQAANDAENTNYANTKNAMAELRRNLVGSASRNANLGAANSAALQALLGMEGQNTQTTTEGLRNINNIDRERTAALAKNAADAISTANAGAGSMYAAGNAAYGSDRSYAAQGAAGAIGQLTAAADTNASQERLNNATNESQIAMNNATNATNLQIEKTTKKTENKSTNRNYNK